MLLPQIFLSAKVRNRPSAQDLMIYFRRLLIDLYVSKYELHLFGEGTPSIYGAMELPAGMA